MAGPGRRENRGSGAALPLGAPLPAGHGSFTSPRSVSGNRILATAEPPRTRVGIMELWGCSLLLLAVLFLNQAQLKRQRFRELDPGRGDVPRYPGAPGTGDRWLALEGLDCPFSLPLWALLVGLSGSAALYVLRFRGPRGGAAAAEEAEEAAFLRDVATVLGIIRSRLAREQRRRGQ